MTYADLVSLAEKSRELEALSGHPWLQAFRFVFHAELREFLESQRRLEKKGEGVLGNHKNKGEPFPLRLAYEFFERAEESALHAECLVDEGRKVWEERWEEMGLDSIDWTEMLDDCWKDVKVCSQLCLVFLRVAECGVEAV